MQTFTTPRAAAILEREHQAAREQRNAGRSGSDRPTTDPGAVDFRTSERHRTGYLSIGPTQGRWLCGTAIAQGAKEIVEFGTSFGISTLYLASAAARTGGRVTGSEYHPHKADKARRNLEEAGLDATILTGDALETLTGDGPVIDFLFLDGAKELYLPVLEHLLPRLRPGSVIVADNIPLGREAQKAGPTADFSAFISGTDSGFVSSVLGFGRGGMSFSVVL